MGPFELMDLIGIDVNYAAAKSVFDGFFGDPRFRPHPIQRAMVESGRLGRKSGRGYYGYAPVGVEAGHGAGDKAAPKARGVGSGSRATGAAARAGDAGDAAPGARQDG